jgi:4-hydroxythreonine-4-phosphate dehydrogenase
LARNQTSVAGGRYGLDTLKVALDLTASGKTDAILFGPLNKSSLHMAGMRCSDELHWFAEQIGCKGTSCEFTVIDGLWTSQGEVSRAVKKRPESHYNNTCERSDQADRRRMASKRHPASAHR